MRAFIVLALIALARGQGYTYGTGSTGNYGVGSSGPGSVGGGSYGVGSSGPGSVGGGSFAPGSVGGGNFAGSAPSDGGSYGGGVGSPIQGSGDYSQGGNSAAPAPVELNKEFFTYSAPEGAFDDGESLNDLSSSAKKNLRVIFIRAPENNGLSNAALNLAKSAVDSKTAIYVLSKQADIGDLANKLHNLNSHNANKPEVHFVKYRTPEDAANAQRAIQGQYDALGGHSQSHNGGVGKVLNFASQPAHHAHHNVGSDGGAAPVSTYIPPSAGAAAPVNTYLPIVKF